MIRALRYYNNKDLQFFFVIFVLRDISINEKYWYERDSHVKSTLNNKEISWDKLWVSKPS